MGFMDKAKNAAEKLMGQGKEAVGKKDQVMGDLKNAGEKAKDTLND
jgi:uncharacterized protein YjbJ (UPF0337 family)